MMNGPQPREIDVSTVDYVYTFGLNGHLRSSFDIVYLPIRDSEKGRNIAAQIDHGVKFDGAFGLAEFSQGNSDKVKSITEASRA